MSKFVTVERHHGTGEIFVHGPFNSEAEADAYASKMAKGLLDTAVLFQGGVIKDGSVVRVEGPNGNEIDLYALEITPQA